MSERIIAVVPIRSLRNGKTRLAPVLGLAGREKLLRRVAKQVIDAARHADQIETILVVSPDPETLTWAGGLEPRVVALAQPASRPGLNGAIDAGREWALGAGASAMLSLFADLPFLTSHDIHGIASRQEPVVLGADRREEGTNALLLRLAEAGERFTFAFGAGSLDKHRGEARRLGLDAALHTAPGIGFDLDTPEDWNDYLATAECCATREPNLTPCGAGVA